MRLDGENQVGSCILMLLPLVLQNGNSSIASFESLCHLNFMCDFHYTWVKCIRFASFGKMNYMIKLSNVVPYRPQSFCKSNT